ncbi:unnamed protein product [Lactuca saligna]|uniref:Uncharacterized protein n=1 Tax=Lactuca saligna TaxID=75948 RepID=A0AA35ZN16_LACSI|nr:unnamed protein product [Lactuca saligna]
MDRRHEKPNASGGPFAEKRRRITETESEEGNTKATALHPGSVSGGRRGRRDVARLRSFYLIARGERESDSVGLDRGFAGNEPTREGPSENPTTLFFFIDAASWQQKGIQEKIKLEVPLPYSYPLLRRLFKIRNLSHDHFEEKET